MEVPHKCLLPRLRLFSWKLEEDTIHKTKVSLLASQGLCPSVPSVLRCAPDVLDW